MEYSLTTTTDKDGEKTRNGKFTFLGKEYTLRDNPVRFALGGLLSISIFIALLGSLFYLGSRLVETMNNTSLFHTGIEIFYILFLVGFVTMGVITLLGIIKYMITGCGQPFIKIERYENGFSFSYLTWK